MPEHTPEKLNKTEEEAFRRKVQEKEARRFRQALIDTVSGAVSDYEQSHEETRE